MKARKIIFTSLFYLLVTAIVVYTIFPFYWAIVSSLKEGSALYKVDFLPPKPEWGNYTAIFKEQPFGKNILNSLVVAVSVVVISLALSVTASYALGRINFRGRTPLLLIVLSVSMFPQVAVRSGMFELVSWLGIYDRLWSLSLSYMILTLPFTTWVLTTFMRELPKELEEAALVDGAKPLTIITKVFLPLLWPALATTGLLAFIAAWNEFMFAITFTLSNERRTVPVAIALISGASRFELPSQRGIAMVFQSYALYPHMTVYENLAFGLKLAKTDKEAIDKRVREAARILQIDHLLDRKPRALSGGQRQRVAIGRAITREPKVFLFDEPLSNLDAALRVQTRLEIARLKDQLGATMIYVTHDQVEAMTLADRIVVLNQGRVEQVGSPLELYTRPRNVFVAGFIGSPKMNLLKGAVEAVAPESMTVRLPGGTKVTVPLAKDAQNLQPGTEVTLGVRPEDVGMATNGMAKITGRVLVVERLGSESYLYVRTEGDQTVVVRRGPGATAKADEPITLGLPGSASHVFGPDGLALSRAVPAAA